MCFKDEIEKRGKRGKGKEGTRGRGRKPFTLFSLFPFALLPPHLHWDLNLLAVAEHD